ncbi:MAG TPA: sigma-70 family RNA polymerase sigma factor [Steroidobacteraceae bacterium]|nr:sigma-70 family RNA polymerase sigma factor [Steroidobacteraceae bacterium]
MSLVHVDRAVARRILGGDEQAFRELFDDYFPKLYRFALVRLDGDRTEARELVQLTFCRAFENLDSFRGESSLYAWFCRICRNAIIDHARQHHRALERAPLLEDDATIQGFLDALSAPDSEQPERSVSRLQQSRLIQAVLDCLPGHYGDVLEWKYLDGLSVLQIAERLALGPKAAESYLTRARGAFREALAAVQGAQDLAHD